MPATLMKVIKKNQELIKKSVVEKKKDDESKAKMEEEAEYAYTPKQGFDWDNVSGAVTDVI
tara:strand:+ start:481 stop:663 length:183 start_codon:yes stop_codon:yes gene_type:complete